MGLRVGRLLGRSKRKETFKREKGRGGVERGRSRGAGSEINKRGFIFI